MTLAPGGAGTTSDGEEGQDTIVVRPGSTTGRRAVVLKSEPGLIFTETVIRGVSRTFADCEG